MCIFFHPGVASSFAIGLVVDVVVGMVAHVVADAVHLFSMVIMFVTVVVMGVTAEHFENNHSEIFRVVRIKFDDVFAFFKVEDGDHCVSRTSGRVGNGLFGFNVSMPFVAIFLICMFVVNFSFIVFIVTVFIIMVFAFFVRERDVVCGVFCVNFSIVCVFFFVGKFNIFVWSNGECLAQI